MDSMYAVMLRTSRRRLFATEKGYVGLGPLDTTEGDIVAVLIGCNVSIVIRKKEHDWDLIGESFLCGIMNGEIMDKVVAGEYNIEDFSLL
jgi:hypothetical protein